MTLKTVSSLALAATCALALAMPAAQAQMMETQVTADVPQAGQGDFSTARQAERNVQESARYDRLVETNLAFREARKRKECGPITDPQLRESCLASFAQYEPFVGSRSQTVAGNTISPDYYSSQQSPAMGGYGSSAPGYYGSGQGYYGYGPGYYGYPGGANAGPYGAGQ
jgi:hypothetical protein